MKIRRISVFLDVARVADFKRCDVIHKFLNFGITVESFIIVGYA